MEKDVKISFEDIMRDFEKTPYRDLIRVPKARHTERLIDGCRYWTGKYWAACNPNKLQATLDKIIIGLGEVRRNRQEAYAKDFISQFILAPEKCDVDTDFLLVIENGVIDLREVLRCWKMMENPSVEGLYDLKSSWFFPHSKFKENHLTHMATVALPDAFDATEYSEDMDFIRKTFLVTFGNQEESFEWFEKFLALSLTGENTGNVFCNLYGKQKTGKSTMKKFLESLFGGYFQTVTTDCLFRETYSNLEQLYEYRNAKLVSVSEPNNEKKDVSLLKKVTGRDTLVFDKTSFTFKASILIDSNHLLVPREKDTGGFDRRYAILPCGPVVQNPDSDLLAKLEARKESFLLRLLVVHATFITEREDGNAILEKPEITEKTTELISRFQNPVKWFFDTWCTSFPSGILVTKGTDMRLSDIRSIFMQGFIEFYAKEFNELYFSSEDFYVDFADISPQKFNSEMKRYHHNYDDNNHGRAIVFHNFIVQNPENYPSTKDIYLNQLVVTGCTESLQDAKLMMENAAKMPCIQKTANIYVDNYSDLMNDFNFPSFRFFNIQIPNKEAWKEQMLCHIISVGTEFLMHWLFHLIEKEKAMEICGKLRTLILKKYSMPYSCYYDKDIVDILNLLFNIYVDTTRSTIKKTK